MPYKIMKNKDGSYKVVNKRTGRIHAYHSTFQNAKRQIRLMEALDHGAKLKL
jgi:hypothetical protein